MAEPSFGDYMRDCRKRAGLTLRRAEELTGGAVSNAAISQIETGKINSPGIIVLHRLALIYGVAFDEVCERALDGNVLSPPPPRCPTCGQVLP